MVLSYTKNKEVHVFEGDDKTQEIRARMRDMCFEGEVVIKTSKTMEILEISGKIERSFSAKCTESLKLMDKFKGRRITGGITKIVYGVIGKKCPYLASLVMECIEGTILGVTAGPLGKVVPQMFKTPEKFTKKAIIEFMPHMKNSCIAYTLEEEK
ncbi:MAG TPA: hypothetical protein VMV49_14835 [Candidatus Deferrimicrobium sp.]|nr:hypothetical protein [Candidatus Deferrimicrobium sp.]